MTVEPFTGNAVADAISVIDDPDGARSGTLSQETVIPAASSRQKHSR
jgi:hypothetical protein